MSKSNKPSKCNFNPDDYPKKLTPEELEEMQVYLSIEDPTINLITRLDLQARWMKLKIKEQQALHCIIIDNHSQREAEPILLLSRRYIRDLEAAGLRKLKEGF